MATVRWLGVDGDLSNVANYTGGILPPAGSDLVFAQGAISITTGLTALSAILLKSVSITTGFTGNMGTNGTSIVFNVNDTGSSVRVSMGGTYIYASITFVCTGSVGSMTIGSTGSGTFYLTGGTFANEYLVGGSSGRIVVGSGVTMGDVYSAGASMDVTPAFTNAFLMGGGNNVIRADVTTVNLGTNTSLTLEGSGVDVTTANCYGGSRLILNNGGATAGVITTANAYPGSYIANGGKYDNDITTLNQWAGSTQVLQQPNGKTTVGTTTPVGQK